MLIFPSDSRAQRLRAYVRTAASLRLFANDIVPTETTRAADLVEPAGCGYAPAKITGVSWKIVADGTAMRAVSNPAKWTFTQRGPVVHGHFAVDGEGLLLWAERFDDPFEVLRPQDAIEVAVMVDHKDIPATA